MSQKSFENKPSASFDRAEINPMEEFFKMKAQVKQSHQDGDTKGSSRSKSIAEISQLESDEYDEDMEIEHKDDRDAHPKFDTENFTKHLMQNYDQLTEEQRAELDELMHLETEVSDMIKGQDGDIFTKFNCEGCGVKLQVFDKETLGYIPKNRLESMLKDSIERKRNALNFTKEKTNELQDEFERLNNTADEESVKEMFLGKTVKQGNNKFVIHNTEVLDELATMNIPPLARLKAEIKKTIRRPIICMRCHKLKFKQELLQQKSAQKDAKVLSDFVLNFDHDGIINYITNRIKFRDVIFKVVDITDFEGTLISEIFDVARENKCKLVLVVNKIDCLPKQASINRIQAWVQDRIKQYKKNVKLNVCLVSAKTGDGTAKVITILNKLKKEHITDRLYGIKPRIFVVGCTNSGKSSLLNMLIAKTTANKAKRSKGKTGKTLYDRETADNDTSLLRSSKLLSELLTASPLPGTTMDFIQVKDLKFGLSIYDTPGIPLVSQVTSHITDYQDLVQCLNNQKIKPISLNIKSGYSIWLGAMARLDFLNGDRKDFCFFVSPHTTIHKTPLLKAQSVYDEHAGTLLRPTYNTKPEDVEFVHHDISLKCDTWAEANYDINISGLGWISIQGQGLAQFRLSIPKEIKFWIRRPLMPFEVREKGLNKYHGNTLNVNTKKNVRGREKFELKREFENEIDE